MKAINSMSSRMKPNLLTILVCAVLTACGGGGGGSNSTSSSQTTGSTPTPVTSCANGSTNAPACSNFQSAVPPATYAAKSGELAAFTQLNAIRSAMGLGLLAQSTTLDGSATAHANYIVTNNLFSQSPHVDPATGLLWIHAETPGMPGYTGSTPADRDATAGYTATGSSEVAASSNGIGWFLDSVYHRVPLLSPDYFQVGQQILANQATVMEFGYQGAPQVARPGYLGVYPYVGQTGVTTAFAHATESPRPLPDIDANAQPYVADPISVHLATGDVLSVSTFTITDPAGNGLKARLITAATDPSHELSQNVAFLVPLTPLAENTTYTVSFQGTDNGAAIQKTWQFTTAPASISLSTGLSVTMTGEDKVHVVVTSPSGSFTYQWSENTSTPNPVIVTTADGFDLVGQGAVTSKQIMTINVADAANNQVKTTLTVNVGL